MSHCIDCGRLLNEENIRTAFDNVYCEDCFSENFNYCSRCDEILYREETHWDNDGNPFCSECYDNEHDDDSPDNPEVYDSDRKLVLQLSRNWLSGKCSYKTLIKINSKDYLLQKLRDMVGLVDIPIYVFGLIDRDEYQVSASPNILEEVKEFVLLNGIEAKVIEGIGCNRLGISHSLRKEHLFKICSLIKSITLVKELITNN